ncbi:hypothetical protein GCM10027448_33380 [Nocardioides dilutus]
MLTFDQPIQAFPGANGIVVTGPKSSHWPCGPARIDGNTLTASMSEVGRHGRYQIDYRVLGADGHPITGSVPIRIQRAAFSASPKSTKSTKTTKSTKSTKPAKPAKSTKTTKSTKPAKSTKTTKPAASDVSPMAAFDVDQPHGLAAMPTWLWIALLAALAVYVGAAVRRRTGHPADAR